MIAVEIIRLGTADIPEIHGIEKQCFTCPWSVRSLEASIALPVSYWFGARIDGRLAGFVGSFSAAGEAEILDVAVDPACRRQGIGRLLMTSALATLRDSGAETVFLDVRRSNDPAVSLYRSLGFEVFAVRSMYYSDPPEDAYGMRLIFNNNTDSE